MTTNPSRTSLLLAFVNVDAEAGVGDDAVQLALAIACSPSLSRVDHMLLVRRAVAT